MSCYDKMRKETGAIKYSTKVSLCSPSHGEVEAGDVLLKVQGHDATEMTHAGAQDVIKKAGGSLKLTIRKFVVVITVVVFHCLKKIICNDRLALRKRLVETWFVGDFFAGLF